MILAFLAILFVFFIPGFILTLIFFEDEPLYVKALFSVIFSICITIILGLILGFNETMKNITGGLSKSWFYMIGLSILLLLIYIFRKSKSKTASKTKKVRKK